MSQSSQIRTGCDEPAVEVERGARPYGYAAIAKRIVSEGLVSDPWVSGAPRFADEPIVVDPSVLRRLHDAAARVGSVYDEAARLCRSDRTLMTDFLGLTPFQLLMAEASLPLWHGIARADVFLTPSGRIQICEINSDTPTGEPEAIALGRLTACPGYDDPNRELRPRFIGMVNAFARALLAPGTARSAAIVYPTELTEDLSLVRLYEAWLREAGWTVTLGSPFNVRLDRDETPTLFGDRVHLILRHYKTDWWGERRPSLSNARAFADGEPLRDPLMALLRASMSGRAAVVNPFGSVVTQNKRLMALMWERLDRFSPTAQSAIREFIPYTVRLEVADRELLRTDRENWVLKSDYGCEGDEVLVGRYELASDWESCLRLAAPGRWVAQRRFEIAPGPSGEPVNYGVFLIGGAPTGLYARVQDGPTDDHATSTPTLVRSEREAA